MPCVNKLLGNHSLWGLKASMKSLSMTGDCTAPGAWLAAGLLLVTSSVFADDLPGEDIETAVLSQAASLQEVGAVYMPETVWQTLDVEVLQEQIRQELREGDDEPPGLFHADAESSPLGKALRVALYDAPALPHVRYRLRYALARVMPEGAGGPLEVSLVEVARFNLGPARRAELVEMLGEERVAPAEQFGEGPDMVWRLVTRPVMGQVADIAYASRRELPPEDTSLCLGSPCHLPDSLNVGIRDWPEPVALEAALDVSELELELLQAGLERLGLLWPGEHGTAHWQMPEWPESVAAGESFIEISLERGLGQDDGLDLVLHYDQLMDHEIKALWVRLIAVPMAPGQSVMLGASQDRELWPRSDWE